MKVYVFLDEKSPKEQKEIRKQLLAYCELDTLAMIKIQEKMGGVSN